MTERASRQPASLRKAPSRPTEGSGAHAAVAAVARSAAGQSAAPLAPDSLRSLQSTVGNRALGRLLAPRLRSPSVALQRDLTAYNKERSEPVFTMSEASSTMISSSAEASGIRAALSDLIKAGKVKEIESSSGNQSWFAANHHKDAKLDEIRKAFEDAGYAQADKMARSLYDIHGEYLYSGTKVTTYHMFGSSSHGSGAKVTTVRNRSLTEYEIRQARRVFKDAIKYGKVTIAEGSISGKIASAGGYARTIGNTINFPAGDSRSMALMIHELTHVWQYQTTGWTYAPKALWAQATEGYQYWEGGDDPDYKLREKALKDARAAGKTLTSFNKEQQGDILEDYFKRLQKKEDVSAWQPFVDDVR